MGNVAAKERAHKNMVHVPQAQAPIVDDLKKIRVDKVHIAGLQRTKPDLVEPIAKLILKATNFKELVEYSNITCNRLEGLECFKSVDVDVDTSKGPNATPDGLEVTLKVKEYRRFIGGVQTAAGTNEVSLILGGQMPNMFGRAESIRVEYQHSNVSTTNLHVTFSKPLLHRANTIWRTNLYQSAGSNISSGYKELDRGLTNQFEFFSAPKVKHIIQWDCTWRNLSCLSRQVPFAIREHSGHSLKSSLVHSIIMDRRSVVKNFPIRGTLLEFRTEYAGVGGDIGFLKNDLKLQSNFCLFKDFVLQGSFHGGLMNEFQDNKRVKICDRFFLGGPLSIRGFELHGAGPQLDRYALGSEMYWATGLHLYGPLPFRIFEKSFGEHFRTHMFVTAGNIGKFDRGRDYRDFFRQMVTGTRMSCGLGVAVKLQAARLEFNYCIPLSMQTGDRATRGFQFGVGLHFL